MVAACPEPKPVEFWSGQCRGVEKGGSEGSDDPPLFEGRFYTFPI